MSPDQPTTPNARHWYRLTPGKLLVVMLAVEGGLLLSERWFPKGWAVLIAVATVGVFLLVMLLWFAVALLFRRRFQFSIRSLMLLTIAVAIPFSWFAVEMKWARKQKNTVAALSDHGGYVQYSRVYYEYNSKFGVMRKPAAPEWLESMLGTDFFDTVDIVTLEGPEVNDTDLEYVKDIRKLHILRLWNTKVTDAGVAKLQQALPNCKIAH